MDYLLVHIARRITLNVISYPAGLNAIIINDQDYHLVFASRCFEWLFGGNHEVLGVELNLTQSEVFQLPCIGNFAHTGFPRIPFGIASNGVARNYQDWEDYYYVSSCGNLAILLGMHMLDECERAYLESICSRDAVGVRIPDHASGA